jgi:hypothetical protein
VVMLALLPIWMSIRLWFHSKDRPKVAAQIEASRWDKTKKNIQRLEHIEMPPPYDHVNCAMCREFDQVKSLEDPDLLEEYEVQSMMGSVTLFKLAERRYKDRAIGQPLDVRPAEYDYIGKPPKAIAQPDTIRR